MFLQCIISHTKKQIKRKKSFSFEFTGQNKIVNGMKIFLVDTFGRFVLLETDKGYQIWNFIAEIVIKSCSSKGCS